MILEMLQITSRNVLVFKVEDFIIDFNELLTTAETVLPKMADKSEIIIFSLVANQ